MIILTMRARDPERLQHDFAVHHFVEVFSKRATIYDLLRSGPRLSGQGRGCCGSFASLARGDLGQVLPEHDPRYRRLAFPEPMSPALLVHLQASKSSEENKTGE